LRNQRTSSAKRNRQHLLDRFNTDDPAEFFLVDGIAAELRDSDFAHSFGAIFVRRPARIVQGDFEVANRRADARRLVAVVAAHCEVDCGFDAHLPRNRRTESTDESGVYGF
jgi:hypothetical protein